MAAHRETSVAPLWQQLITHSTCSFVTCADHPVLFQSLYQRTNRTRGSKILRCFPHCCPHHLDRNFCGSPLLIRVENSKSLLSLELLVFTRFRLVNSVDFGVGDCIAASDILSSIQSEQNPNGEWITADEQISLAQTHSRSFLLNPRARWFYSWESGVAKAHRLQEHALRVLVLAPVRLSTETQSSDFRWLRVVAAVSSPPFKLISFRRATQAAISAIEEMPRLMSSPAKVVNTCTPSFAQARVPLRPNGACDTTPRVASLPSFMAIARHTRANGLAVIFAAAGRIPVRSILGWMDRILEIYDPTLADPVVRAVPISQSVRHWLETVVLSSNEEECPDTHQSSSPLVATLSLLAAWTCYNVDFNHIVNQFVRDGSKHILDRRTLHMVFDELVSWVWDKLDRYLCRLNWSMVALVRELSADLSLNESIGFDPGFQQFVAQVREHVVDQNVHFNGKTAFTRDAVSASFNGVWAMNLQEVHLRRLNPTHDDIPVVSSLGLTTIVLFQRQLGTIRTTFDLTKTQFSITSLPFAHEPTQLRLDTHNRWFRRFPAGESTLALPLNGYSFGDYVGSCNSQQQQLHWDLYAWPDDAANRVALCLHFQVNAMQDGTATALKVVVQVIQGDIDADARRLVTFSTLSLKEKLCLVPLWTPTHLASWIYHRRSVPT